jgi:hypothetical protein
MNETEVTDAIRSLCRAHRQWGEWRGRNVAGLAEATGATQADEAAEMRRSWHNVLIDATAGEVQEVMEAVDDGRLAIPFEKYGDAHRIIATEVRRNRTARRSRDDQDRASGRRYTCLECTDSGMVTVYNPRFVEWLRPQFAERQAADLFPKGWFGLAVGEWYRKVRCGDEAAEAQLVLACCCKCHFACNYRTQIQARKDGKSTRSAVMGVWHPAKQCRVRVPQEDLSAWYAEHDASELHEWEPTASEYQDNFR